MNLTATFNNFKPHWFNNADTKPVQVDYEANSPYLILGIKRSANDNEVKRAWRKLMMTNHPDLGGDVHKTMAIHAAYKAICKRRGI